MSNGTRKYKDFYFWFMIFGQNTCNPTETSARLHKFLGIPYVPQIISWMLTILCSYIVCTKKYTKISKSEAVILCVLLIGNTLPNIFVIWQSFSMPASTRYLEKSYKDLSAYVKDNLGIDIDVRFPDFKRNIHHKVKCIVLCTIFSISIRLLYPSPVYGRVPDIFVGILVLYKIVAIIHAVFYIETSRFMLISSSRCIVTVSTDKTVLKANEALHMLRHLKIIHFKIYQVYKVLNTRFGWILIAVIIESLVMSSKALYWIFVYSTSFHGGLALLLRKYIPNYAE